MNNQLVGDVADYVHSIMYYCWGEDYYKTRSCPFETFEAALAAYQLHVERCESRNYLTLDDVWNAKLREFCYARGIKPTRKLRRRKKLL